jgi:glycosyltransferase involved in cell wall biosynthesis
MEMTSMQLALPAQQCDRPSSASAFGTNAESPVISVIVPVRNSPRELRQCLERLLASNYSDFEVIVVDDGSTDDTAQVPVELGALVLQLGHRRGPAAARNRGAGLARGEYLFFLDADVCVYPETLQEVHNSFAMNPDLDAVFGSYDTRPLGMNVLSEYKNLFHHFVHQHGREEATTFWTGCGAIRRSAFREIGGFSAHYSRPSIEDIELGRRLHAAGRRIMLNKRIQVTHLKYWSLWSIVKTDVLDRGIPWTQLILREGRMPNDLNLKVSQRISVVLAYGLLASFLIGVWYYWRLFWLPLIFLVVVSGLDYWSINRRYPTVVRLAAAIACLGVIWMVGLRFNSKVLLPLALLVGIILINVRFYLFFLRTRRLLLLTLLLPLHLLYFLYCGLALVVGALLHLRAGRKESAAKVRRCDAV